MPHAQWPFIRGRPIVPVVLTVASTNQDLGRNLLADTGAGAANVTFELVLNEADCIACGGFPATTVVLGGAFTGSFPVFAVRVRIPALAFDQFVQAVGVPSVPRGLGGIACFPFLNRFTYGNFGNHRGFGLET